MIALMPRTVAPPFHPDLAGKRVPNVSFGPVIAAIMRRLKPRPLAPGPDVTVRELVVPGPSGAPDVGIRVFQPVGLAAPAPVLFWIHGGGLIGGSPEQDDRASITFARELGITVAAVRYRLAPVHPAPAAIDDVHAGLRGLLAHAAELDIDLAQLVIGGASAGGGLAAALVQRLHDDGDVPVAFQLLVYPMLDDRTPDRTDMDTTNTRIWTPKSNLFGWTSYIGDRRGSADVPAYWAAARREELTGLPPAWIGVGTLDLFHDEDVEYARRLEEAGVPVQLDVIDGVFHGFDAVYPTTGVAQEFLRTQVTVLRTALVR